MKAARWNGWPILGRASAAILGGYALIWLGTAAVTLLLSRLFGVRPFDAVLAVTMSSFLVWAIVAMAVFHVRSARMAWAGIIISSAVCMIALFAMTGRFLP